MSNESQTVSPVVFPGGPTVETFLEAYQTLVFDQKKSVSTTTFFDELSKALGLDQTAKEILRPIWNSSLTNLKKDWQERREQSGMFFQTGFAEKVERSFLNMGLQAVFQKEASLKKA
ncbi:MAG TPA: hypothetical protein VGV92_06295 [Gammaproteobacteria bacterium]|nr:hypothetical protein [Gammaproteobacteria bacterium]